MSGEPNTAIVRVDGQTDMLPAGFKAIGVGRGALCMTCHNSRNGERSDVATETADDRAPHTAAQADVLMGQDAYSVQVGQPSKHALVENSCTDCHLVLALPSAEYNRQGAGTNHDFGATMEVCSDRHGAYNGDQLHDLVEAGLHELEETIAQAIIAEISAQTEQGKTVTLIGFGENDTDVVITADSAVSTVEFLESHGRSAIDITVDDTIYEHVQIALDAAVFDGDELTLVSSPGGQLIAKADWNCWLVHGDGSQGVHNPSFTLDVIEASIAALEPAELEE